MATLRLALQLGWRNLWRNKRRTGIMLAAIGVGAWAMIFVTAFSRGMVDQVVRDGIRALPGHVQIHHPGFRDDPSVATLIDRPRADLVAALTDEAVTSWTSRVRVPAVVSSERETRGVTLVGIDPETERDISFVADDLVEGRFLESPEDKGLILGRKMAERLETGLGKRVVVMSQTPSNDIAERGFRIVGLFESELEAQELGFAFAGEEQVQSLLEIGDRTSEIAIAVADLEKVKPVFETVEAAAGEEVEVAPWFEVDSFLFSLHTMMDSFVYLWVIIVFLALSFGLVNTLVMAVFERVREIGLMLALGVTPRNIRAQIVAEALLLLVVGLVLGNVAAWVTLSLFKDGVDLSVVSEGLQQMGAASVLIPSVTLEDVLTANVLVLVLGFFASLSPAWRASRLEPVEAITKV
ncbi:MAG: FtsX-like permease family protein [Acidobacteriota bacterium]